MSAPTSVLYDAPGPKAIRRSRLLSVVSVVVFVVLLGLALLRLYRQGQFEADLWSPLFWPGDEQFPAVWGRIGTGVYYTLLAAVLAIAFSLVIGTLITTSRLMLGRTSRLPLVLLIEILRGTPVIVLIFFSGKFLPAVGVDLSNLWYLVIGLVLYNCVVIAEILRAGVAALPRGQSEAGLAIGLTRSQTVLSIQLPQAFRLMLPALISQLVVIVKDTSLAYFVLTGPEELLRIARQLRNFFDNPVQIYLLVAIIFILVNTLLSRLAVFAERKLSESRAGAPDAEPDLAENADQIVDADSATHGSRGPARDTHEEDPAGHGPAR
ncbi:amino acid ABC transporter permease [Aquipuribacter sp. SD81]|uniref:amino acid ABC transporter permease n=1 Tax=Aquipuribacter sp. SD81 TaxID=3127703 RepID=UPI003019E457